MYINQGFFKNYTLFDVDRARRSGSDRVLAQITGEIEIKSQSPRLMFNADRTEINENPLTEKLKTEIERLNIFIQKTGAKYKHPFIALNRGNDPFIDPDNRKRYVLKQNVLDITGLSGKEIENLVKSNISDEIFSKHTTYTIDSDKVTYNFFDVKRIVALLNKEQHYNTNQKEIKRARKEVDKDKKPILKPAIIELKQNKVEKLVGYTGQIDLYDYIIKEKTLNSLGKEIAFEDIKITDDKGFMKTPNILPSVDVPQNINIVYDYYDENTDKTSKMLTIVFLNPQRDPMEGRAGERNLIHTHGIGNFQITFDLVASNLVNQINSLTCDGYAEMIACSLRTLFELGVDAIRNKNTSSNNLKRLQVDIASNLLKKNVKVIVEFIEDKKNRSKVVGYLNEIYSNVSFNTLKNISDPDRIATRASESNLGAHKGTTNLTKDQIVEIANDVSAYLIFVEGILGAFGN